MGEAFRMDKILGACERLMYILAVNFCFLLGNLPVLLFFLFVGISQVRTYLPLFLLAMTAFEPALGAVIYCMNRLIDNTETNPFRNFWHSYREETGKKFLLSGIHMLLLLMFYTNMVFFGEQMPILPLMVVFAVLFAVMVLMTPVLSLLSSRYRMKNRDIFKTAGILLVTRPGLTLANVAALGLVLMCLEIQAGTTVLFMGSVYGFLVAFMSRRLLRDLEQK